MSLFSDHMNTLIDNAESSDALIIDANRIADILYTSSNVDSMTVGELRMAYTKARLAVALYERGYRSIVRGKGFYADPAKTNTKEYAERILKNAELSEKQKRDAIRIIKKGITDNKNIAGQLEFDENMEVIVSKSDEDILEMLAKEA